MSRIDTPTWDGTPRSRAERFIVFCDGLEEAGLISYAHRGRVVARDLLDLMLAYEAEHDARVAMQRNYERAIGVMQSRRYAQAIVRELRDAETTTAVEGGNAFL